MMVRLRLAPLALAVVTPLLLAACAGSHHAPAPVPQADSGPALGHGIGIYKVGQPYKVNGVWYYPSQDMTYDETGIASWYGPDFDQRYTANGEVFDQNEVSAAHKTLPMPSIVQVTNLDNGRSIQVRVNDRGPYVGNRIIDMSRRAAQMLGFETQGTAKVRVRVLVADTIQAQSLAKLNGSEGAPGIEQAQAAPREKIVAEALPPPSAPPSRQPQGELPKPPQTASMLPGPVNQGQPVPPGPALSSTIVLMPVKQTHIFVQAGAFTVPAKAEQMKVKLAAVGPAFVTVAHINGTEFYRVRLGPVGSVDEADSMLAKTQGIGVPEAKIVVD